MNFIIASLFIGLLTGSPSIEKKNTYTISGKITTVGSYCGGMAPSEEMLREVQAIRPKSGFMIYVRKGKTNNVSSPIIDSTFTDDDGIYSFNLPKGDYVLLQKNQVNKTVLKKYSKSTQWLQVDTECLKNWWEKGLTTITISGQNIENLDFHFQKRCFVPENIPCLGYLGPYPP